MRVAMRPWLLLACMLVHLTLSACVSPNAQQAPQPTATPPISFEQVAPAPNVAQFVAMGRADSNLIPRDLLFGSSARGAPQISPDGTHLAFLAPVNNVINIWVAPLGNLDAARPVTNVTRNLSGYQWAFTNQHLLYLQDNNGDENTHVFIADLHSGETRNLTPVPGARASIARQNPATPEEILITINDRDPAVSDLYRVNILTGAPTLVFENTRNFSRIVVDAHYQPRFGFNQLPNGRYRIYRAEEDNTWVVFRDMSFQQSEDFGIIDIDAEGTVYFTDAANRDTRRLIAGDTTGDSMQQLAESPRGDIDGMIMHPANGRLQAVSYNYIRPEWTVVDPAIAADVAYLNDLAPGDWTIVSRSLDDTLWTVAYNNDTSPVSFYLYHRTESRAELLFTSHPDLEEAPLAQMHARVIPARDGLEMVAYYSLPPTSDPDGNGIPNTAVPLVLLVHGGPQARDRWGFNPEHQWLTNRGYATLSLNYRGSDGLGKSFMLAGARQWGLAMHTDWLDAVDWMVQEGIADRERIAIMGSSYGGYQTLWAMTNSPEVFACGVAFAGVSNLVTFMDNIPSYWEPLIEQQAELVGEWRTEEGRADLLSRSPISHIDNLKDPLFIAHGATDPRTTRAEADQMVQALVQNSIPVTYALFPDEGHGFTNTNNQVAYRAAAEQFLASCLNGSYQPIGEDFNDSSIMFPVGEELIPEVHEAINRQ